MTTKKTQRHQKKEQAKFILDTARMRLMVTGPLKEHATKLVWIRPVSFLERVHHRGFDGLRDESLSSINEAFAKGVPLPPLILISYPPGTYPNCDGVAEGRNRAYIARKLGVPLIPVLVNKQEYIDEAEWNNVIDQVVAVSGGVKRIYSPLEHPFFKDWEVTQICSDRLQTIVEYVGEVAGKEILDIGCFFGYFTHKLALKGAIVTGIDVSPPKIRIAQSLSRCYGLPETNPVFYHSSYQDYLRKNRKFDIALYLSQFHHELRDNPDLAWKGIKRISKCAKLLFLDMNENIVTENVPALIVKRTSFKNCTPLKKSCQHERMMYVFS